MNVLALWNIRIVYMQAALDHLTDAGMAPSTDDEGQVVATWQTRSTPHFWPPHSIPPAAVVYMDVGEGREQDAEALFVS